MEKSYTIRIRDPLNGGSDEWREDVGIDDAGSVLMEKQI